MESSWWLGCIFIIYASLALARRLLIRNKRVPEKPAVFITGCDSGIGRHLALQLDSLGCEVFAGCLRPALEGDEAPKGESPFPSTIHVVPLDVTSKKSVATAVQVISSELRQKGKELWCLVNNAGVCIWGEFGWQTWTQIEQQVKINLFGTFLMTRHFLPLIRKAKGRIVIIGSVNGIVAYPGLAVYSATKFALEGFCDSLRREERCRGVDVVLVRPGDLARHTSIMANHERHAQNMWKALSTEERDSEEGRRFRQLHAAALRHAGIASPARFDDTPLWQDLRNAVLGLHPAYRYTSAALPLRCFICMLHIFPTYLSDAILTLITDYMAKSASAEDFPVDNINKAM